MSTLDINNVKLQINESYLIKEASLSLNPKMIMVISGPNGSGKTTLLRLASGLIKPTSGAVFLDKHPIIELSRREIARKITLVPQHISCSFAFTVYEIVAMGRNPHLKRFDFETYKDKEAIDKAMEQADIKHLANRTVTKLSGGELQRVAIARSLATEADIVLLDEPTANLDIAHTLDILELCKSLANQGKAICITLHDINLAIKIATHAVFLKSGKIFSQGSPNSVFSPTLIKQVFGVNAKPINYNTDRTNYVFEKL